MLRHERLQNGGESPVPDAYVPWLSRFAGEFALSRMEDCQAAGPRARLASLTALLRDLAEADNHRRQTVLREFLGMLRAQIVQQAQASLVSLSPAPEFWVRDAREWITENGRALTSAQAPRLRDWPKDISADQCADHLAQGLRAYADQLDTWPALWDACRGRLDELVAL